MQVSDAAIISRYAIATLMSGIPNTIDFSLTDKLQVNKLLMETHSILCSRPTGRLEIIVHRLVGRVKKKITYCLIRERESLLFGFHTAFLPFIPGFH